MSDDLQHPVSLAIYLNGPVQEESGAFYYLDVKAIAKKENGLHSIHEQSVKFKLPTGQQRVTLHCDPVFADHA